MLHDVRLVNGRDLSSPIIAGVLECGANDSLGARDADWLDRYACLGVSRLDGSFRRKPVDAVDQFGSGRLGGLELDARIQVFGVFADDDQVDRSVTEKGPHARVVLARSNARKQAQFLAQMNVDAAEAGAHGRGDGGLQGTACTANAGHRGLGQGRAAPLHHVGARLLNVPVDRRAGCVDATACRVGQFRPYAVTGNQRHFVSHDLRYPAGRVQIAEAVQAIKPAVAGQRACTGPPIEGGATDSGCRTARPARNARKDRDHVDAGNAARRHGHIRPPRVSPFWGCSLSVRD